MSQYALATSAAPLFTAPYLLHDSGDFPVDVAVGDLNGDQNVDLVTANARGMSVSVLLGDGNGAFTRLPDHACAGGPTSVVLTDLNMDGRLDVVTSNGHANYSPSATVSVFLGGGDGSLGPRNDFATQDRPNDVAVADFDDDGYLDLAVANAGSDTVSLLRGLGDGTFVALVPLPTTDWPFAIAAADLDHDGRCDLVVTSNSTSEVSVHLNDGIGGFGAPSGFATGNRQRSVAIADLDGDGALDLATANSNDIAVLMGHGDGTFGAHSNYPAGLVAQSVVVADLDLDGILDLAVANRNDQSLSVLQGNGDGSFDAATHYQTGVAPSAVAVADFTSDHRPDLVAACNGWGVALHRNRVNAGFGLHLPYGTGGEPGGVDIADFNEDGAIDVAVGTPNNVAILTGYGNGTFASARYIWSGTDGMALSSGDLNGDGHVDLVLAGDATVLLGDGNGMFGAPISLNVEARSLALGDLNGDGRLDMVTATTGNNPCCNTVSVMLGRGDGTFDPPRDHVAGFGSSQVALGDMDLDGNLDVAVANVFTTAVSVFLGNGDGSLQPRTDFTTAGNCRDVAVGDLNDDGKLDLATAHDSEHMVSVFIGIGDGTFQSRLDFATAGFPYSIALSDLDDNGALDIVTSNPLSASVTVLLGSGDGSFPTRTDYGTTQMPVFTAIGHLDTDGAPDLVVANESMRWVSILLSGDRDRLPEPPVLVPAVTLEAATLERRVLLSWTLPLDTMRDLVGVRVQRAAFLPGPFEERTTAPLTPSTRMSFEDDAPGSAFNLWYRLVLLSSQGGQEVAGLVNVQLASSAPITALWPPVDPAGGNPMQIRYSVGPGSASVEVAIFDVRGRSVWQTPPTTRAPGTYTETWNRQGTEGARVVRGVYFVQLQADGRRYNRKIVVLHQ